MSHKYGIVVQARCGSTRLPNKILLPICKKTVLEHIIRRLNRVKKSSILIIATTIEKKDLEILKICFNLQTHVYCGSTNDVLDRYYQAARLFQLQNIIRITSDCPLIDPQLVDQMILCHEKQKNDYSTNSQPPTYPDGEDIEIMTYLTLKKTWQKAKLLSEREHVTSFIYKHPKLFSIFDFKNSVDLSNKRWTLDYPEDYKFIKKIYQGLYNIKPYFSISDIIKFIQKHPELENINKYISRNIGYQKSLKLDKKVVI